MSQLQQESPQQATKFMLAAVTSFAVAHSSVKWLGHIPAYELVFFRAIITLLICGVLLKRRQISPWGHNRKILLLRGLFGTIALVLFFYTLQKIPLASAITIQHLSPIFTIFIAAFVVAEKTGVKRWLLFLFAFAGVWLVKGFDPRITMTDLAAGLGAAFFAALAYNMIRLLRGTDHPLVVVFYFPLVTIPLIGPLALIHWVAPNWEDWPYVLAVGVFTQIAQVYMTRAYQAAPASKVGIVNYLGVVYALVIGYTVFGETLNREALIGIGLIILSISLSRKT